MTVNFFAKVRPVLNLKNRCPFFSYLITMPTFK